MKRTFCWFKQLNQIKGIEVQVTLNKFPFGGRPNWFVVALESRSNCDHAGVEFRVELLRIFYFHINYYDLRHWDYDNNQWF